MSQRAVTCLTPHGTTVVVMVVAVVAVGRELIHGTRMLAMIVRYILAI